MNDNVMDPFHVHVLHSTFSGIQFHQKFALMPKVDFFAADHGVCYSAVRAARGRAGSRSHLLVAHAEHHERAGHSVRARARRRTSRGSCRWTIRSYVIGGGDEAAEGVGGAGYTRSTASCGAR